jgi:rSAM/selenodomain-associated transferase 1
MSDTSRSDRRRVLGLFAKRPDPGKVKTRLATETSPEWAARVADALLRDTLNKLARINVSRVLAFAPADARSYFSELVQDHFALVPQLEGDLGMRMKSFFQQQIDTGADAVVLVGSDSPSLPMSMIEEAFDHLQRADVVLGPTTDGGYYLVGCGPRDLARLRAGPRGRAELPPIFDGIPWSSDLVLRETMTRLADPSWRLAVLPPWYDIDTLSDWHVLQGHMAAMRKTGIDPGLPHTTALFADR